MVGGVEFGNIREGVSKKGTPFDRNDKIQSISSINENYQIPNPNKTQEIAEMQTGENLHTKNISSPKSVLLQRVKEKMGLDNLETASASDFMKSFNTLQNGRQLSSFYAFLQEDSTGTLSNYIKKNLSLDDKVKILEELDDSGVFNDSNDKFGDRNKLIGYLFTSQDRNGFLKKLILKDKDSIQKIYKIEKYFMVRDIITTGFGYDWFDVLKSFGNKALNDREKNNSNYGRLTSYSDNEGANKSAYTNETVARFFMLKIMDSGSELQKEVLERKDENGEKIFSKEKSDILRNYGSRGGVFVGLVNSLVSLNNGQLNKLNGLTDDGFVRVLESISNNEKTKSNITKMTSHNVEEINASEIAYLIDIENIIERQISDFVSLLQKKGSLDKHPDYTQALEIEKQDFAKNLYISSQQPGDWDSLSYDIKQVYIDKWNNLSKEEKDQRLSKRLVSRMGNSSSLAVMNSAGYPEMTQSNIAVARIRQNQSLISRSISNMDLTQEDKSKLLFEVSQQAENSNRQLFQTAQRYGFTEDLRTVRGEEYYQNIEQSYIQSYDKNFEPSQLKYQESSLGGTIKNKIFSNIENENLIFGDREIPKKIFNVGLNDKKYLDKIYPSQKNATNNLLDENKKKSESNNIEKKEASLYNDTNKIIKDEFKDRLVYFLGNCFDIKLDNDSQKTLLENLSFDKDSNFEDKNNGEISLAGKDKAGKKIKISYNIESGLVKVGKWIHFDKDSNRLDVDKKETSLSFVKGPKIDDFYQNAKRISYFDILKNEKTNSISDYSKEVSNQLKILAPLENQSDFAKEELNKNFLVDLTLQEIGDIIGIRSKLESSSSKELGQQNKDLFSLLSRSFSSYDKKQIEDFRGVFKFMVDYNNEFLSKQNLDIKSSQYIDKELDNLSKSIGRNNFKNAQKITNVVFEKLRKGKESGSFNGEVLHKFFSSFLSDKERFSGVKNTVIDTRKLLTYHEDLSQENQTDQELDYIGDLNENMKEYLADYGLEKSLNNTKAI